MISIDTPRSAYGVIKILLVVGLLVPFSVPFPIRVSALVTVGAFSAFLIWHLRKMERVMYALKSTFFILIAVHVAIQLIGLMHSEDVLNGYRDIERYSYALILPLAASMMTSAGLTVRQLVWSFTLGTALVATYALLYIILASGADQSGSLLAEGHTLIVDYIGIHPTYLSLYFIFIFFCLLEMFRTNQQEFSLLSKRAALGFLFMIPIFLLLLRSQLGLLIFASTLVLYLLMLLRRRAAIVGFCLVAIGLVIYFVDVGRVKTFFDNYGRNVSSALDNRLIIWKSCVQIVNEFPLAGTGTGSEQLHLNRAYNEVGYSEGALNSFNAHNQYLEFAIRNGLLELAVFLAFLVFNFYRSLSYPNYAYLILNVIFSLTMIAESCLTVQKGIVFFYLFTSAFTFMPFDRKAPLSANS